MTRHPAMPLITVAALLLGVFTPQLSAQSYQPKAAGPRAQPGTQAVSSPQRVRVRTTGAAPLSRPDARQAAVKDALRRAVEAGGGVEIDSVSQTQDFILVRDTILARATGFVESYVILGERPNDQGLYRVRVQAVIARDRVVDQLDDLSVLLQRKGKPRLMVVGNADGAPADPHTAQVVNRQLHRRGLRTLDADQVTKRRGQRIREAQAEGHRLEALAILHESGAEYLVIASVTGQQSPSREVYGLQLHAFEAVGRVRVVEAATGRLLADHTAKARVTGRNEATTVQRAKAAVLEPASEAALRELANHWLNDVDPFQGGRVSLVLRQASVDRFLALMREIGKVEGVREVRFRRFSADGQSELEIATHASAEAIAAVLRKLDPTLDVLKVEPTRIEVR